MLSWEVHPIEKVPTMSPPIFMVVLTLLGTKSLTFAWVTSSLVVSWSLLMLDEAESPQLNPPPNVIDLDLEAIIIQVLPRRLFVPPPPLSKNMFQRLELVPVVVPSVVESIPTFLLIKERVSSLWRKDFNTKALIQASMLGQSYKDMLREVGPLVSMHSIICFVARSWGIVEFWEVIRANKTLLLSAEESRESLTHVETKLKEYKPREKALNINLTTAKNLAKALQEKVEHLNK
ncbi:hypothetical protein JHK86_009965 [Glycine max]|nr:hypothetical protein JHK86_009965 [Glycine max]